MTKYHIKIDGSPGLCKARVRACPRGDDSEHYPSKDEARKAFEETQKSINNTKREPILYEKNQYNIPEAWVSYYDETVLEATDAEHVDYYSSEYTAITQVDLKKMVSIIIKEPSAKWSQDLKDFVENKRSEFENPDKWSIDSGYYEGDTVTIEGLSELIDELEGWYYNQKNANDRFGILEHVREKGYETKGLRPLDSIKKMLREENDKVLKAVENTKYAAVHTLNLADLRYSETHYKNIEKVKPVIRSKNSNEILGVVLMGRDHNDKRLIDGHHRFKWASHENRTTGNFIVIN